MELGSFLEKKLHRIVKKNILGLWNMINRQHLIRKTKKELVLDALRVILQEKMLNFLMRQ